MGDLEECRCQWLMVCPPTLMHTNHLVLHLFIYFLLTFIATSRKGISQAQAFRKLQFLEDVRKNNHKEVSYALKTQGVMIANCAENSCVGNTPLHIAVANGYTSIVEVNLSLEWVDGWIRGLSSQQLPFFVSFPLDAFKIRCTPKQIQQYS
jgi:hypothetical protein